MEHGLGAIPIANPSDAEWQDGLFLFSFGAYGWTRLYVWDRPDAMCSALETAIDWLADNAPGIFHVLTEDNYRRAADDLGLAEGAWDRAVADNDEETIYVVVEEAQTDMTMVSHTCYHQLKGDAGILSWEWGAHEVHDRAEWYAIRMRSDAESEASDGE